MLHYRRTDNLVVGLLIMAAFGTALGFLVPSWLAKWGGPDPFWFGLFPVGVCTFFTLVGVNFVWKYITDRRLPLVIDEAGVTYGKRHFPWAEIGMLGRVRRPAVGGAIQLFLQCRGLSAARFLKTDDGLPQAEYDRLMRRLKTTVGREHPHLRLGVAGGF